MKTDLQRAVMDAVNLVNTYSGQTSVRLLFNSDEMPELDFVANSAILRGHQFEFTAGFETYGGSIEELLDIRAEVIDR
jgi:hypothetical protein